MKNAAEEFAEELCRKTFLSLWTYPNPRGKAHQELCDLLIVCDPDVLVISVKGVGFKDTGRGEVDMQRWQRSAVDESVKQVFGAERRVGLVDAVTAVDGMRGLAIPGPARRRVHRIALVIGGEDKAIFHSGEYEDKGVGKHVHVFDKVSFGTVLQELDTITDLVNYLRAREAMKASVIMEGEENLLAMYLQNGRSFPSSGLIIVQDGCWDVFRKNPQYLKRKKEDRSSYVWDRLIETFCEGQLKGDLLGGNSLDQVEQGLRTMAREDRFTRRVLGKAFVEFLEANKAGKSRSRICAELCKATYVFLGCPIDTSRENRVIELQARCVVARVLHPTRSSVVGIATETSKPGQGFSMDMVHLDLPEITPDMASKAKEFREKYGYFKNPLYQKRHEDEYPSP